jgi:hypothetical protein
VSTKAWQARLDEFRRRLDAYDWFSGLGIASAKICNPRVDFNWMVENDAFQYSAWGEVLRNIEAPIDRAILNSASLELQDAAYSQLKLERLVPGPTLDRLFLGVDEKYSSESGYYGSTYTYPHEIVHLPQRLISYAAMEHGLNGAVPASSVLSEALDIFSRGFWPAGWRGNWPDGSILVW